MKLVIDIDGTILYSKILKSGDYEIIGVNKELIDKINEMHDSGHEIILHTGRHWKHLQVTREQLFENNVKFSTLVLGKPVGDFYIDDVAIRPDEFTKFVGGKNNAS